MSTIPAVESPEANDLLRLFRTSRPARRKLREIEAMLGASAGHRCLCVGGEPGVSPASIAGKGDWTFAVLRPGAEEMMRQFVPGRTVITLDPALGLDFPDSSFDTVVVVDALERVADDYAFTQECHRILKEKGYLLIATAHDKTGLLAPLRRLAGMGQGGVEAARPGYTQRKLYDLLKDGYDITEFRLHSTFWEQLGDLIQQIAAGLFAGRPSEDATSGYAGRVASIRAAAGVLTLPLALMETLFGWGKGYQITARARARIWKERREVKIRDGRSIAEATIRTKIGTATAF